MNKIPLSEMIKQLRQELLDAQADGDEVPLRFEIQDIEIELTVATTKEAGGGGGVKFWVYNADAKVGVTDNKTQKLKLKLKPVHGADRRPFDVGDEDALEE